MSMAGQHHTRRMFITYPHFEFPIPAALGETNAQHWRLVEFDVHLAWFILSVERQDESPRVSRRPDGLSQTVAA